MKRAGKNKKIMARIKNISNTTLQPSSQQAINNAAAWAGVDEVLVAKHENDGNNDKLFRVFDADENYLFTIDTEGDVISE